MSRHASLSESKLKLKLQLNHPRGDIASQSAPQNARRWLLKIKNSSKRARRVGTPIVGEAEIRMVENIEELETHSEHHIFRTRDLGSFYDGEVGCEIARPPGMIAALG